MPVTVADVLALPVVAAGAPQVRAGARALSTPVRWVHVSEQTEVAGTLGGGELVLSTGMALAAADLDAGRYLTSLADAGAVGLVVELGTHLRELPDSLVRAAAAATFPLVELSRVVRFVAVTEQVHARILHEQYERLAFADRVHSTFASLSVGAGTVAEVVAQATVLAGHAVVLEDLSHHAIAVPATASADEVLRDWPARSRRVPAAAATTTAGPESWLTTPVGTVGRRWGRLVLPERLSAGEASRATLVLERAAETLTISRLLERGGGDGVTRDAHEDLLHDLLRGRSGDEADLRARARALGLPVRGGLVPVVLHVPPGAEARAGGAVTRALATSRAAGIVGTLRPGLVGLLVSSAPDRVDDLRPRLADQLHEALERVGLGAATTAGTAATAATMAAAGEGFAEAAHVAEVAASLPHRTAGRWHRAGDLGVRGLLWWLRDDPRLQAFAEAQLAPLLTGAASGELLDLLRAHLEAGGSMTRLAARLHLSRPAAYGRVERLRTRLGRDLDDPETRLSLHLALLAHDQGTS